MFILHGSNQHVMMQLHPLHVIIFMPSTTISVSPSHPIHGGQLWILGLCGKVDE
jgi:hypothetical protein